MLFNRLQLFFYQDLSITLRVLQCIRKVNHHNLSVLYTAFKNFPDGENYSGSHMDERVLVQQLLTTLSKYHKL